MGAAYESATCICGMVQATLLLIPAARTLLEYPSLLRPATLLSIETL